MEDVYDIEDIDKIAEYLLTKAYEQEFSKIDNLTDVYTAINKMSSNNNFEDMDKLLAVFDDKCKDFQRVHNLLTATHNYKEYLPSRESLYFNAFELGYATTDNEDSVDYFLEGLE
jgi:hypothetical protein